MFVIGVLVYARTTTPVRKSGRIVFLALVAILLVIYAANVTSPPPPNAGMVAYVTLAILLFRCSAPGPTPDGATPRATPPR